VAVVVADSLSMTVAELDAERTAGGVTG